MQTPSPIIDIHTHVFPDAVAAVAIPALETEGDVTAFYDGTVGGLLTVMDRAGIDVSVVQPVATKASQVCTINDFSASLASDRIIPFGAMHPDFADPAAEVARMASLGIRGFKMHPEYQAFEPHEPRMAAIYDAAVEHDMILLFHAGGDIAFDTVRGTPEAFGAVLDAWPDLCVILAHLGGFRQWEAVAEHVIGRDVWLDTSYTLDHLPDEEFLALVRAHGTDRVLFGSDGPWTDPVVELAHLEELGLADDEFAAILGGNARRLLDAHARVPLPDTAGPTCG